MNALELIIAIVTTSGLVLGGVFALLKYTFKVGGTTYTNEKRLSDIEAKTQHAKCLNNSTDLTYIKRWIMKLDNDTIDALSAKFSPRKLTPVGEKILELSHANNIMADLGEILIQELTSKAPPTALDVETEAYFTVAQNENNPAYKPLKDFIYNSPEEIDIEINNEKVTVKLDYDAILRAVSLNLRDTYLSLHPNIV